MDVRVLHGDALELLPTLSGLDSVVCDPPYGLEFMSKKWDAPWKHGWQSGGGFSKPGIGERKTEWPSFSATSRFGAANPTCGVCGGRARGAKQCGCSEPQWKPIGKRRNPENEGLPDDMTGGGMASHMQNYQHWCEEWARLAFAALKPGAHLMAFGGTRTFHRMACAIEDAGFEIRDTIMWVYGSGFPKSRNLAAAWSGWGTALKPAWEPIIVARRPLVGTVAGNVLKHGTGAINVDGCRVPTDEAWESSGELTGGLSQHDYGNGLNNAGRSSAHTAGRWPANLVHDGSDEVLALFPETGVSAGGGMKDLRKGALFQGETNPNVTDACGFGDSGSAARFFKTCPYDEDEWNAYTNASDAERTFDLQSAPVASVLKNAVALSMQPLEPTLADFRALSMTVTETELSAACSCVTATIQNFVSRFSQGQPPARHILSNDHAQCVALPKQTGTMTITVSLWRSDGFAEVATLTVTLPSLGLGGLDLAKASNRVFYTAKADSEDRAGSKHPTVKPLALMRWLVRLVTPPGGTVLDCFAGSGTTGEAARLEGFNAVLIEREAEYVADIRRRLGRASGDDMPLFA